MISPPRPLILTALLLLPLVAVAEGESNPTADAAQTSNTIAVDFNGNLRDALKAIAEKGGLNLVVTGDLDQDAQVHLTQVTAEEALRTVATAYNLKLQQSGRIWTLRPMTAEEIAQGQVPPPTAPAAEAQAEANAAPAAAAAPALPDRSTLEAQIERLKELKNITPQMSEEAIDAAMREAEALAEQAEAEAQTALRTADRETARTQTLASDSADDARAYAKQLRDQAKELRELAREARDHAAEARKQARNAIREAHRAAKNKRVGPGGITVNESEVVESAVAYGGPLVINGHVEDDAVAFGGDVTLGPKAWIEGDVVAFGGSIHRAEGAIVEGEVHSFGGAVLGQAIKDGMKEARTDLREATRQEKPREDEDSNPVALFLGLFILFFTIGFLGHLVVPERLRIIQAELRAAPTKSGVMGILGAILLLPVGCITFGLAFPVAVVSAAVGFAAVANELGTRIPLFKGRKTQALVLALGLTVILAVGFVPVVGQLIVWILALAGFGAVIRTRFGSRRGPPGRVASGDLPTATPV